MRPEKTAEFHEGPDAARRFEAMMERLVHTPKPRTEEAKPKKKPRPRKKP